MRTAANTGEVAIPNVLVIAENLNATASNKVSGISRITLEQDSYLDYLHDDGKRTIEDLEIVLKENSTINFYLFSATKDSMTRLIVKHGRGSRSNIFFGMFDGAKLAIECFLDAPSSESNVKGMFFSKEDMKFEISTDTYHNAQNTKGDIVVQGALSGSSEATFHGMIKIPKSGQKTNSFLSNHNLLLSKNATCRSIPSLKIDANDVKASHGATIGKPDEEMVFYIMARGVSRKESEKLLIKAHFSKVLDSIPEDKRSVFEDAISKVIL